MPDSPDQIIRKLQQENKNLKKILDLERRLWSSREADWDPSTGTDLHRIEVFDGVISDESSLHSATLCSKEEFQYILERAGVHAAASGDMPLFRDDESRVSDPGNRCKLRLQHTLLMELFLLCCEKGFRWDECYTGEYDCHSDYQQFGHGTIQYIIAHEMGHYLGLRHVDDKSHLMHSGEIFNVDSASVYDDLGLGIPHLERPEIATVAGLEIQSQIDKLNAELDKVSMERQDLKDAGRSLDDNTETHNGLVQEIQKLEDQLTCVNLT